MSKTFWEAVSAAVERVDTWADRLPTFYRDEDRWHFTRAGGWGCAVQLWCRFDNWLEDTGRVDRA